MQQREYIVKFESAEIGMVNIPVLAHSYAEALDEALAIYCVSYTVPSPMCAHVVSFDCPSAAVTFNITPPSLP